MRNRPRNSQLQLDGEPYPVRASRFRAGSLGVAASVLMLLSGCSGGERPVLDTTQSLRTTAASAAGSLPPAPEAVIPLLVPRQMSPEPTMDDALDSWEANPQTIFTHVGPCEFNTPQRTDDPADFPLAELCDSPASQPNTKYLGPDADTVWHVVGFEETVDGFRVIEAAVAGR